MVSANDQLVHDFEGVQPASDNLSEELIKEVTDSTTPEYQKFIQARLVSDSIENARKIAESAGSVRDISEKLFFLSDEDMGTNGSIGNSFALVKPGKPGNPLRIIIAHSDVPSLRIPVNPVYAEGDSEKELACPSLSLYTEPFGGVRPEDWYGTEVDIIGKLYLNGTEKRIFLPGRIRQKSVHVDDSRAIKTFEGLKVDTGFRTAGELYNALGIECADDFARAKLYCLPHFKEGNNGRLIGNELGAFGHDDRSCVWASLKAGLDSLATDNTTLVFGLDNEEIGSVGNSGSYRGFFESVLKETLKVVYKEKARDIDLPSDLNRKLLGDMPAIFADVGVGMGSEELDDPFNVNSRGASRMGWGVFINSGIITSPKHVDKLITLLERDLPGENQYSRYQIGGDYTPVDSRYGFGSAQMHDSFGDVLPCLNVGIPVTGLHHPRTETINIFDLHWMKEAFKVYLRN
jgi:aspartyl aminopeptidase